MAAILNSIFLMQSLDVSHCERVLSKAIVAVADLTQLTALCARSVGLTYYDGVRGNMYKEDRAVTLGLLSALTGAAPMTLLWPFDILIGAPLFVHMISNILRIFPRILS